MDVAAKETKSVARGSAALLSIYLLGAGVAGFFSGWLSVGAVLGTVFAVLNFWLLGTAVGEAIEKPPDEARRHMAASYIFRMFLTFSVLLLGVYVDYRAVIGIIPTLFFPKASILLSRLKIRIFKKSAARKENANVDGT